jgi:hypothetical protein
VLKPLVVNQDKGLTQCRHQRAESLGSRWWLAPEGIWEASQGTYLLSEDSESIGCPDEFLGEAGVVGGMASVFYNHQPGT